MAYKNSLVVWSVSVVGHTVPPWMEGTNALMDVLEDGATRVMEEDGVVRVMEEDGVVRVMDGTKVMEEAMSVLGFQHINPVWSVVSVWPTDHTT